MGREIKRVPIGFDWPLNKTWGGFLNPFYFQSIQCSGCAGSGSSPEAKRLEDLWYGNAPFKPADRGSRPFLPTDKAVREFAEHNMKLSPDFYVPARGFFESAIRREAVRLCDQCWNNSWMHHINADDVKALIDAGRLMDFTHTWSRDGGWKIKDPPYMPTPQEVNEWSISCMGHDSINCWTVVRAEAKRLGYSEKCKRCAGEGLIWPSEAIKKQHKDWKQTEPPTGEAYQLWQTTSEGSPISPPFATPEELADWLCVPGHGWWDNDKDTTRDQWLAFIRGPGWAPFMVAHDGVLETGVQAVSALTPKV